MRLQAIKKYLRSISTPINLRPRFEQAVAYLEAEVIQEIDVGTHTIFIGRLVDADVISEEECLTYDYYHQVKRGTTPKTAPSYIKAQ